MKKIGLVLALTLVFAPSALAQTPSTNANQNAMVKTCKNLKAQMGKRNFNRTFAPRTWAARAALRNCARKEAAAVQQARMNAAHACRAWAAGEDEAGFEEVFGTGTAFETMFTGPSAHGKCVSTYVRIQNRERRANLVNAAKTCAPGRRDGTLVLEVLAGTLKEGQTFTQAFSDRRNAYGKCVSFVSKVLAAAKAEEEATTP